MTSRKIRIAICLVLFASSWASAATRHGQISKNAEEERDYQALATYAPKPDYPLEGRWYRQAGSGLAVLEVDSSSGKVRSARMEKSTGVPILDQAALNAFRQWRFEPGKVAVARIPVVFNLVRRGVTYGLKQKKSNSMNDALANFLGREAVVEAPIPRYPGGSSWLERHGSGVYELHVGKDGAVNDVRILKPSGDATFDRITLETLRKWRLRTGPKIIELPLAFKLTPKSYDVGIP
jgi:TonB family protein